MSAINTGKVIVGGLVAGLVYNVLDTVNGMFIMGADFKANAERLHLDPAAGESTPAMVTWIVIDFLMGILVVWTYAAMRPRFGAGPRTAAFASLTLYLAINLVMLGLAQIGLITMGIFIKMAIIQLVINLAGAMAGAAVYKE